MCCLCVVCVLSVCCLCVVCVLSVCCLCVFMSLSVCCCCVCAAFPMILFFVLCVLDFRCVRGYKPPFLSAGVDVFKGKPAIYIPAGLSLVFFF